MNGFYFYHLLPEFDDIGDNIVIVVTRNADINTIFAKYEHIDYSSLIPISENEVKNIKCPVTIYDLDKEMITTFEEIKKESLIIELAKI